MGDQDSSCKKTSDSRLYYYWLQYEILDDAIEFFMGSYALPFFAATCH